MTMSPGLVTTIIPVHNRSALLREAVASVLAQTYRPIEIIIVDDGSSDETPAVCDELAVSHEEIRVIHQANGGPGKARETARRIAGGSYVQHLDSDDILYPRKFELQVAGLVANPSCGISYGWTRSRSATGVLSTAPIRRTGERHDSMFPSMLRSRWWHTSTPLYRASVIEAAGPWLDLRNEEDWEYDARIAATGPPLHYCEEWLSEARAHGGLHASTRASTAEGLRDRAAAHERILAHARRAGMTTAAPEMQHFSRELFLLARQCGAAGLPVESRRLFELAREAADRGATDWQFRAYDFGARILGWSLAGRLACLSDRLRREPLTRAGNGNGA